MAVIGPRRSCATACSKRVFHVVQRPEILRRLTLLGGELSLALELVLERRQHRDHEEQAEEPDGGVEIERRAVKAERPADQVGGEPRGRRRERDQHSQASATMPRHQGDREEVEAPEGEQRTRRDVGGADHEHEG